MRTSGWINTLAICGLLMAGCQTSEQKVAVEPLSTEQIRDEVLAAMNLEVNPCEDFYEYACGNWIASTELPGDETRWSRSFSVIDKGNREFLREYLEAGTAGSDPELGKLGLFYRACADEEAVEAAGTEPVQAMLQEIAEVADAADLMTMSGRLQAVGIQVPFSIFVAGDFKDSDTNIAHFFQGGLGMPDRDYYLKTDKDSQELLEKYRTHVSNMLQLIGETAEQAKADADAILAFETELAKVSRTRPEMRQVDKLYNKLDIGGLKELTPSLPWDRFLAATGYPDVVDINVGTPEFFTGLESLVAASTPETLRAYLRWHLVTAVANQLPKAFVDENFDFYSASLRGQEEIRPRWRRCVSATDTALGELLGRGYVEHKFPGDSKEISVAMIRGIEDAFQGGLDGLSWMDDETRSRAVAKMEAITNKIGYPDEWRDYSSVEVRGDDYFGNTVRANTFEFKRNADKIGNPVDPKEWGMTPPQVNAYYNPLVNEIVFPAGILQKPFFHRDFPAAMNFGGIGMVMGHELTHGFDDQGSKFDPDGEMVQWWEQEAVEQFKEQTACVEQLYNGYEVQEGLNLNGRLTLGENIADIGGLKEAYRAYKAHAAGYEEEQFLEELTNDQLFFVGFAQTWCSKATDEAVRLRAKTDSHSHAKYRVVGPVSQSPEFAQAFSCEPGAKMNPVDKCVVW